jgi:hypothetical protein
MANAILIMDGLCGEFFHAGILTPKDISPGIELASLLPIKSVNA